MRPCKCFEQLTIFFTYETTHNPRCWNAPKPRPRRKRGEWDYLEGTVPDQRQVPVVNAG